jgi:hypothetical protein
MTGATIPTPSDTPTHLASLLSIWNTHRNSLLLMGQELHARLQPIDPSLTIHGRDLRPESEGVGFQFQLLLPGPLGDGAVSAYYVVQVQLRRQVTSLAWQIDAMPVLDRGARRYDLFPNRSSALPLRDRARLRRLFEDTLADDATRFLTAVRDGRPLEEPSTTISADTMSSP